MVGPVSQEERAAALRWLRAGVAVLIAGSAGLIALQAEAGFVVIFGVALVGFGVGALVVWLAFPAPGDLERRPPRRR